MYSVTLIFVKNIKKENPKEYWDISDTSWVKGKSFFLSTFELSPLVFIATKITKVNRFLLTDNIVALFFM